MQLHIIVAESLRKKYMAKFSKKIQQKAGGSHLTFFCHFWAEENLRSLNENNKIFFNGGLPHN